MIYRDPIPLFEATIFFTKRERGVSWVKVYEYIKERNKKNPANDELDRLFGYLIELESRLEKAIRVDNETVSCLYRELKPDKNDDGDYSDSYLASIVAPDALNKGLMLDEDAYFASLHNNIDSIPMRIAAFLLDNIKPDREYSVSELLELINKSSIEPENKLLLIEAALNPEKYIYMLERTVRPIAAEFRRCDKLTRPFVELYRNKYCNGKITPEEIVRRVWKTPDNITEYNIGPNIMFGDTCLFNRMGQDSTTLNCYMGAVYDFLYCGLGSAEEFDQIDVEGKIAFIKRGTVTFSDKIANATAAGAAGIILYNNTAGMLNLTLTSTIPFGLMSGADGDFLAEGLELGDSFTGEIIAGAAYMALTPAESSSWGTTSDLKMKPEIMAPGQNINSANGSGGYELMSGSSMATPHIAGAISIIKQYLKDRFPDATAAEINSLAYILAMNTANQINGFVRQQGAGLIDINKALNTDVYITVPGSDRPKFEDMESETGEFTFSFELHNIGEVDRSYTIDITALCESVLTGTYTGTWQIQYPATEVEIIDGSIRNVSDNVIVDAPETILVPAGSTATLTINVAADDELLAYYDEYMPVGGMFEGWVRFIALDEDGVDLSVPFLGYIGDWDEPSMLDRGYYWQVATGETSLQTNGSVHYNTVGFGVEQGLGLNRYWDMTGQNYNSDRNAVSPNGDGIYDEVNTFQYSMMRNSVRTTVTIEDLEGNVIETIKSYVMDSKDHIKETAFGSGYTWHDIYIEYDWDSLEENETVNLVLTTWLDHEGYDPYNNESGRWVVPVTKDTTAPGIFVIDNGFRVVDSNYIAYVAVYNDAELTDLVFEDGVFAENRGEVYWHQVNSNHYYVTVADYAGNEAVYEIEDGLVYATSEYFFDNGRTMIGYATENYATNYIEDGWISFKTGAMAGVTVLTEPENVTPIVTDFFEAEYKYQDAAVTKDGYIYCVDEDGNLDMIYPDSFYAVEVWTHTSSPLITMKNISYDKYSDRLVVYVRTRNHPDVENGTHFAFFDPDTGEFEFTGIHFVNTWGFEVIAENTIITFTGSSTVKKYSYDGTVLETLDIPCYKPDQPALTNIGKKGLTGDMIYDEVQNCIYVSGHWSWLGNGMFATGGMFRFDLDTHEFTIHRVGANTGRVVQAIFFEDQLSDEIIELESFELSVSELDMNLCETAEIDFIRNPTNANHYTVEWTSSDENVVTVSGNKYVADVNAAFVEGSATITCTVYVDDEVFGVVDIPVTVSAEEELNAAANVEDGTLLFASPGSYPFAPVQGDDRYYLTSTNQGVHNSVSEMFSVVTMEAGETLEFDYFVSSEVDYDFFNFYVNDECLLSVATIMEDWDHYVFTAPEDGEYTFTWTFEKDPGASDGLDCAYVDNIDYSGDDIIIGDVDGNGEVNMADAVIAARHAMGIITLSDEAFALADMDGDGFVTMLDAVLIMRLAAIQD